MKVTKTLLCLVTVPLAIVLGACGKKDAKPPPQGPVEVSVVPVTSEPVNHTTELPGRTGDPLATAERQDRTEIGRATAAAGQQLLLLNLIAPMRATYGHSFWRSYGVDLRGFAMGLLWSLLLVGLTWLILRL